MNLTETCLTALAVSRRHAASYPTPGVSHNRRAAAKTYNFLTHDRLIPSSVAPFKLEKKEKEAKSTARSRHAEQLEELRSSFRYFTPQISDVIIDALQRQGTKIVREGISQELLIRLHLFVLNEATKHSERDKLIELMKKMALPVPAPHVWNEFSNESGDVIAPLLYSPYVNRSLVHLSRALLKDTASINIPMCYIARHLLNESKVPSLHRWCRDVGPLRPSDIVFASKKLSRGRPKKASSRNANRTLEEFGRQQVLRGVSLLSAQKQKALMSDFLSHPKAIMSKISRYHLFAQTVLTAVNALPDIRVLLGPFDAFNREFCGVWYVRRGGAYYPEPSGAYPAWRQLSPQERNHFSLFGAAGSTGASPITYFTKYCQRDYGLDKTEARERMNELSDLVLAAVKFPFPVPISSDALLTRSFRLFLRAQAVRYGLRSQYKPNRLFTGLMRMKWMQSSVEEQRAYEEEDVGSIFPLQPTKHMDEDRIAWSSLKTHTDDADGLEYLKEFERMNKLYGHHSSSSGDAQSTSGSTPEVNAFLPDDASSLPELTVDISALELQEKPGSGPGTGHAKE